MNSPTFPAQPRLYLDHAATTPLSAAARAAVLDGMARWANPSSPHAEGRAARAALEDARARIGAVLGWNGPLIFTSGASESIAIALGRAKRPVVTSPVEHDAVLRVTPGARRLAVDAAGRVTETVTGALHAIQQANNETGVIQPIADLAARIHEAGGQLFCDCAQSAGKLVLPAEADMIAISAHKFGGPPGIGALLLREWGLLEPSGGQEQGYRGGTENLPGALALAAALEDVRSEEGCAWFAGMAALRAALDEAVRAAGGEVVADGAARIPTIASYRMPGMPARAQLIRFDMMGIAVSAGAACSSGTLKTSPVLKAMGWDDARADEVVRVSFGRATSRPDIERFADAWRTIHAGRQAA